MTSCLLDFGKKRMKIDIPDNNFLGLIGPHHVKSVTCERKEIERALRNPIGNAGIEASVRKDKKTIVVVDDYTRPTPIHKILPIILNRLNEVGIEDQDIKVLVALGTHRVMTEDEIIQKIGKQAYERVPVLNHYWKQKEMLIELGKTPSGVPLIVNRNYLEASLRIGIGHIVPHCQAGWTGGAKIVQPGVCGAETTDCTHWLSAGFDVRNLLGVANNPVRLEIENVVRNIGLDFIVNVILNDRKEIVKTVCGDFVEAHRVGVEHAKTIYMTKIPERADTVICDALPSGYAVDLWQAGKAIISAYLAVKKGGTIILIAPCPEGVSTEHPELSEVGHRPYAEVKKLLQSGDMRDLNAAATSAQIGQVLADGVRIVLYSRGISRKETERLGFEYTNNPQDAIDDCLERYGYRARTLVMQYACEILPVLET
jgi:nickel-dependent lactate racemase